MKSSHLIMLMVSQYILKGFLWPESHCCCRDSRCLGGGWGREGGRMGKEGGREGGREGERK